MMMLRMGRIAIDYDEQEGDDDEDHEDKTKVLTTTITKCCFLTMLNARFAIKSDA